MDQALGAPANKYILLFALGFVLPLCWFIAAILPLPVRPNDEFERLESEKMMAEKGQNKGKERATELQPTAPGGGATMGNETNIEAGLGLDLRNKTQIHQRDWAQEERLWQKAKWWRRVNRVMSVVGVGVIAAVVALAVIYTR
ncbi:hypothetical protein SLS58_005551 [Diplodia intermedia]|uniref:Uncharacterized protein n=1 Tax=Diplodia intermedia TaxID=856260 RepID=A0ABR3TQW7_9PEZI